MSDSELVDFILEFTQEMNGLEIKYFPLIQNSRQNSSSDTSAIFTAFQAEAETIYRKYLTEKERTYYFGIGSPPKFAAVNTMVSRTVERTKNRAVVTICTGKGLLDFQFMLVCKKDKWLINSFKQRYHSENRSVAYQWQYGSF